jgi:response regulator of citrate/malate metabolism
MATDSITNEKLFTPKGLAETGIISTVKQWMERKNGRLNCYRIGSKVLYSQKHINEYLALCEQQGQTNYDENTGGR